MQKFALIYCWLWVWLLYLVVAAAWNLAVYYEKLRKLLSRRE